MFRKNYLFFILTISFLLAATVPALAQTQPIGGRVILKKADDTTEPVQGALVEIFRVDQKSGKMSDKTDKGGSFSFAGVIFGGTYVLSVSGEGISPKLSNELRAGSLGVTIEVQAGDGRRLTEAEVREIISTPLSPTGELSADDKAKAAADEKKIAELKAKNEKAIAFNEIVGKSLEDGVKAFNLGNYDLAITLFEQGIVANPTFIGSAPALLNNKAASLTKRGTANYNKLVNSTDKAEKAELKSKVQEDFESAIDAYAKSWMLSTNAKPEEIVNQQNYNSNKATTLAGAQDTVRLMVKTEMEAESQKDDVRTLMQAYVASENDAEKKIFGQNNLGSYLLRVGDYETAVVEYRKAFVMAPKNPNTLAGLALSLYTASAISNDTAQKQEALNYMQYFLDTAPDDHPFKKDGSIEGGVTDLKAQKLKPQKITVKN